MAKSSVQFRAAVEATISTPHCAPGFLKPNAGITALPCANRVNPIWSIGSRFTLAMNARSTRCLPNSGRFSLGFAIAHPG